MKIRRDGFRPVLVLESPWYERAQPIWKYVGPVGYALDIVGVLMAVVTGFSSLVLSILGLGIGLIGLSKLIKLERVELRETMTISDEVSVEVREVDED